MKILAALLLLAALPLAAQDKDTTNLLKVGEEMPEFTVAGLDEITISSDDLYGKVVLVSFTATFCVPCNLMLPFLEKEIWNVYKDDDDFVLLIIDREEPAAKVSQFVENKGYTMPFYLDPAREVYSRFALDFLPRNYLFDKQSRLVLNSRGSKTENLKVLKRELSLVLDKK
jgi:peroxiredoxin